jgi:nitrogen fixation protein NifX
MPVKPNSKRRIPVASSSTGTLRVAVASRDGKTVHQHFGRATAFQIFDIHAGVAHFVETRDNAPTCGRHPGADEDDDTPRPPLPVPPALTDCCAVVVAAIGPGALARLGRNNIRAFVFPDFIDVALARCAAALSGDSASVGPSSDPAALR